VREKSKLSGGEWLNVQLGYLYANNLLDEERLTEESPNIEDADLASVSLASVSTPRDKASETWTSNTHL
jgi:hypothetical protein